MLVSATLAINAIVIAVFAWAYFSPRFADKRINTKTTMREPWGKRIRVMSVTSVLSLAAVFGTAYVFQDYLIATTSASWGKIVGQAALVLLVYDFLYYFLHRIMHIKKLMKFVHGVHHRARNPSALESFYLHPVELFAGVFLMYACVALVGPIDVYAFGIVFFVYSTLNIVVHSGLIFGGALAYPIDFLARKHHIHHNGDFDKNFSSLTPLPDLLFGTAK